MTQKECSSNSQDISRDLREQKRAKFAEPSRQRSLPLVAVMIGGVVILAAAGFLLWRGVGVSGDAAEPASDPQLVQPAPATADTSTSAPQPTDVPEPAPLTDGTPDGPAQAELVRLPVATFDDGKARFLTHQVGETSIEYFVLKSSDGVLRAAFNACDVCFEARKGYRQEGDQMICNNCGLSFPSARINEVQGGCNPAPLERTVEGDELVIRVDDILAGISYFE
jgi:hypothetical protein